MPVARVELRATGVDLAVPLGPDGAFDLRIDLGDSFRMNEPTLILIHADGSNSVVPNIGQQENHAWRGHQLFLDFLHRVESKPTGNFLEIGARARSGITRREHIPEGWNYVGLDIQAGKNVDVVGDAHELSQCVPHNHFDAVMSLSVFEHLLMPWKVVVEMNRVMVLGAIGFVFTHQSFPLHDEPWDYLRFSKYSWPAFFNERTGFRIIEAGEAEPVYLVGERWNPGVNHNLYPGMTVSSVLVEKVGETSLTWDVGLRDIVKTPYPA
jgi:Methyltransferase domain